MHKIIFAGTPEFAVPSLERLINAGYDVVGVFTQPDRPAGRGQKLTQSPVKQLARKHRIPVHQPITLRHESQIELFKRLEADACVVVAYGLLIPPEILEIPRYGCINIHASLLPRWRGAAPIQRSLLAGDEHTGITIMQMNFGLDTGPILCQLATPITPEDTAGTLHDRLSDLGATLLLLTLPRLSRELIIPKEQPHAGSTFAGKIIKKEAELNWFLSGIVLERMIRAFNPWPICFCFMDEHLVRVHQAEYVPEETAAPPGTIIHSSKQGIYVSTGKGLLRLLRIQLPGGPILPITDILNARTALFAAGQRFTINHDHESLS